MMSETVVDTDCTGALLMASAERRQQETEAGPRLGELWGSRDDVNKEQDDERGRVSRSGTSRLPESPP